jgi:hypothetical protein
MGIFDRHHHAWDEAPPWAVKLGEMVGEIERLLNAKPARIALAIPQLTRKGVPMANYELANDTVATIGIMTTDANGDVVPMPAGDVFTVVSSNPASLTAAIGATAAGGPAVVLTPLVKVSPGLTVTVSDSKGLPQDVQIVDIVNDVTPRNVVLDLAGAATVAQPVPTAPGP